jgi:hypothetical protein
MIDENLLRKRILYRSASTKAIICASHFDNKESLIDPKYKENKQVGARIRTIYDENCCMSELLDEEI